MSLIGQTFRVPHLELATPEYQTDQETQKYGYGGQEENPDGTILLVW